jgi:sugar lactone lactonase YvrE
MDVVMASTPTCVLDARASLGECPVWSVDEQVLYWVDINEPALHRFDPRTGRDTALRMPSSIGSFALRAQGGTVVALRDGVYAADAEGRLGDRLAAAPYDTATHRFNDGRCDRQGRFLVGTMNERRDASTGALYRLGPDGRLDVLIDDVMISNGLAFSPDGRTMYHADTATLSVQRYDYDIATGRPAGRRDFARWTGETDRPDGAAVDSAGNYWVAFYRGGKLMQLAADGRPIAEHPLPAMCPTMCAFGGPDLRTLYITTARQQRDADELARLPQSGGRFAMRVDVPVLPEPRFAG